VRHLGAGIPPAAWALFAVLPLLQLTSSATYPIVPEVRDAFALSYTEVGVFLGSLSVARLLFDLPAGQLATRFHGRRLLWISAAVTLVACVLGALATAYWHLLVARVLIGVMASINQAVILSRLVGLADARNRARVMGYADMGFSIMVTFTPALAGVLAVHLSWRAPFVMGGVAALLGLGLVLAATRGPEPSEVAPATAAAQRPPSFGGLLPTGGSLLVMAYALTVAIFFGRHALSGSYLPAVGGDGLGMSSVELGLAFSGLSLIGTLVTLVSGMLADRWGRAAMAAPCLALLLLAHTALLFIHDVPTFFLITWFAAIGAAPNPLPGSLIGDALPAAYRGLGMATYRLIADSGILLGPLLAGLMLDHVGYGGALALMWVTTAACLVVTVVAARGRKGEPTPRSSSP
jgi:predicted MFS family arabinose efflux permease